jgi:outer membrane lipoprotein-sorting protein
MLRHARARAILLASVFMTTGTVQAQTVDELVARNLEAKGGADKLRAVTSVKITGKISAQGTETTLISWLKRPNLFRRELQTAGTSTLIGFDGKTVWSVDPRRGSDAPEEVTGPMANMFREQADFDGPLLDYKQRGFTIELVGKETYRDKPVYHLKITSKSGQMQHFFLDAETGLEAKTVTPVDQGGLKGEAVTELSNYQKVNGFAIPFTMQQSMGTDAARITLEKVEFNVPIDESMFRMPAKK